MTVQARQVLAAWECSRQNGVNLQALKSLRRDLSTSCIPTGSPWDQGYSFAHRLRQALHLNGEKLSSLTLLGKALDVPLEELDAAIIEMADLPGSLDVLVATNSRQSPGFAVPRRRREDSIRFAFCRALFEYLTTREGEPLLVTRARSDRQKRNRAFAAELLVPADLLREALPGHSVGDDEVDDLAAGFGVSATIIRHQLENHHLARTVQD